MKVVLLNLYYRPADAPTARLLADVGEHLAARGHEVVAISSRRSYSDPKVVFPAADTIDGVRVRRTPNTGFGRGRALARVADYLSFLLGAAWRLLVESRTDVVVSLTTPPLVAVLGGFVARLRGARSVFWVMDVYPDLAVELGMLSRGSVVERVLRGAGNLALRRSDRVIALGDAMAERLSSSGAGPVTVIHNWADGEVIRPRPIVGHPLRAEWGWDERFVVLYSGNLGLAHEFDTLLDAAELLREERRVLFALVGDGPRRAAVEDEVRRRALPNVELRPPVPEADLPLGLTSGDLHLVTLRPGLDGLLLPSKIYGVLAAGRPAIYVGAHRDEVAKILHEGRCGAQIETGDADSLAETVRAYAADPGRVETEGAHAREWFDRRFDRRRGLAELSSLIEEG